MNTMCNYDFIFEVSPITLQKLIQQQMEFEGIQANPPFEFTAPLRSGNITDDFHCIVHQVSLRISAPKEIELLFNFYNSSIAIPGLGVLIGALDGKIAVALTPQLIEEKQYYRHLGFDYSKAKVNVTLSGESQKKISAFMKGKSLPGLSIETEIHEAVGKYLKQFGIVATALAFKVIPGMTGYFSDEMQFEQLDCSCIPHQDINKQAIAFFGNFLLDHHGKGDPALKTTSDIPAGKNIAVLMSPECFHKLVICPNIARTILSQAFDKNIPGMLTQLPQDCGVAGSTPYEDGVHITQIQSVFADGAIHVTLKMKKEGTCYEANATQVITIFLNMNGSVLEPKITYSKPSIHVNIPWYCSMAGGFSWFFSLGFIIDTIVENVIEIILENVMQFPHIMGFSSQKMQIQGMPNTNFNKVDIKPDAFMLEGNMYVALQEPKTASIGIELVQQFQLAASIEKEVFHNDFCAVGDFDCEIIHQLIHYYFRPKPQLLGRPLALKWSIDVGIAHKYTSVPISFSSGKYPFTESNNDNYLVISSAPTQLPHPLPDGKMVNQDITLGYRLKDGQLTFYNIIGENTKQDGNYTFYLHLEAQDPTGNKVFADDYTGAMNIYDVKMLDYEAKMADCLYKFQKKIKAETFQARRPKLRVEFPPIDHPDAKIVKEFYDAIGQYPSTDADKMRSYAALLFGTYFYEAISKVDSSEKSYKSIDLATE